jgi:hypothetical protein
MAEVTFSQIDSLTGIDDTCIVGRADPEVIHSMLCTSVMFAIIVMMECLG